MNYKDLQGYPLQEGQGAPFAGRLVDSIRDENGIFVHIPFDMLNNAGLIGTNKVEVWGETDGTIGFRIATRCEICKRGARLYELDMGFAKKNICADDYFKLTGKNPPQETQITENPTQTDQS